MRCGICVKKLLFPFMSICMLLSLASCGGASGNVPPFPINRQFLSVVVPSEDLRIPHLYPAYVYSEKGERRFGYLNDSGEFVIKPQFKLASPFMRGGRAEVFLTDSHPDEQYCSYQIDEKGNILPHINFLDSAHPELGYIEGGTYFSATGTAVFSADEIEFTGGLLRFSDNSRFGYADLKGNIIIQASLIEQDYWQTGIFEAGWAYGELSAGEWYVYNNDFTHVARLEHEPARNNSFHDGLLSFYDDNTNEYGFLGTDGKIAIKPMPYYFRDYLDGFVTGESIDSRTHIAMDTSGEIVLTSDNPILNLGQGLFGVIPKGVTYIGYAQPAPRLIYDFHGNCITETPVVNPLPFSEGISCVYDNGNTILIGKDTHQLPGSMPIRGLCTELSVHDGVVRLILDDETVFVDLTGKLLNPEPQPFVCKLGDGISIVTERHRPDIDTLTYIPRLTSHPNAEVMKIINLEIFELFDYFKHRDNPPQESFTLVSKYGIVGDVLTINAGRWFYAYDPFRSYDATVKTLNLNINTGESYSLTDFLKPGTSSWERLSNEFRIAYGHESPETANYTADNSQEFLLTPVGVVLMFDAFELTGNWRGDTIVPYDRIEEIINEESDLWAAIESGVIRQGDSGYEAALAEVHSRLNSFCREG